MSALEDLLAFHIHACAPHLEPYIKREYKFHRKRKWRLDFVIPAWLANCGWPLAIEVEGGAYSGGRHVRGKGFEDDCEKYAEAMLAGFRILRVTDQHIKSGQAIRWIERALK